jgi:hypothetical protein
MKRNHVPHVRRYSTDIPAAMNNFGNGSWLPFPNMQLRIPDESVFERIGQAVDQSLLQLGREIPGGGNRGMVFSQRDLMFIGVECSYVNCCRVCPILDIHCSSIPETKFIPVQFMPSHLNLLSSMVLTAGTGS